MICKTMSWVALIVCLLVGHCKASSIEVNFATLQVPSNLSSSQDYPTTQSSSGSPDCQLIPEIYRKTSASWPSMRAENVSCKETKSLISNWLYIDELKPSFHPLVTDKTMDERLANLAYWVSTKPLVIDAHQFNSGNQDQDRLNEQLVAGSQADDAKCGQHLSLMLDSIDELKSMLERRRQNATEPLSFEPKHIRLARVLDSFGRYESGHLDGRTYSLGDYEQCSMTALELDTSRPNKLVKSRYCWARFSIEQHLNPTLKSRYKSQYESSSHVLSSGICIPETCHSRHFQQYKQLFQQLVDGQFKLPSSIYIDESLELESIFCIVDENSQVGIPISGKVLLALLALWLLICCYATAKRDEIKLIECQWLKTLLKCLDLKSSWQEFVMISKKNKQVKSKRVELNTINPIKWLGCAFVIWGHTFLAKGGFMQNYIYALKRTEEEFFGGFVVVGTIIVDTFFAVTAMVAVFVTMKKIHKRKLEQQSRMMIDSNNNSNNNNNVNINETIDQSAKKISSPNESQVAWYFAALFYMISSRYLRLLPLLAIVYWFKRSVFIYMGSGPLWDYGFNQETANGACQNESWLLPFTFTTAFVPLSKQCLMQSWSVSNDIFFFLICTPIILIMTRHPKLAASIAISLSIASIVSVFRSISFMNPIDNFEVQDLRALGIFSFFSKLSYLYTYPHYRITSFAIGMVAGYLLYYYEKEGLKEWPNWFRGLATKLSFLYIFGLFVALANSSVMKNFLTPYHYHLFPFFLTFGRLFWALANSVLFLRMTTDWNKNYFMQISSSDFWSAVSKINYALLLIHYDLIQFNETNPYQTNTATLWSVWQGFSTVYLTSTALSILIYVILENPIDKLVKKFVFGDKS